MSYSTMAHALIGYVESHLENFDIREMSESFGFSEIFWHVTKPVPAGQTIAWKEAACFRCVWVG